MVKPTASSCPWDRVRRAGEDVLKSTSTDALTWGNFKRKLATALHIDVLLLKEHRVPLQELVAQYTAQEESTSDDENQDDEEEDSDGMMAMRALARAMGLGPKPLVGLKQMTKTDAERTLKNRLRDAGAKFKGPFPSTREIAQARRKTETAKDLEGIDMSNVVAGSRRRRRSEGDDTSPPKKKRRSVEDSDIECSGEESSSEEDSEDEYQLSV